MRHRLEPSRGSARKGWALERFEPCEVKVSRTVLGGGGRVNRLRLLGDARTLWPTGVGQGIVAL
jgi:hypothetical protein